MILLDRREGSNKYEPLLEDAVVVELEYGDVAFTGKGEDGRNVEIGIEIKTLSDLLNSISTGRLVGHQIPGLIEAYEVVYLVVEGMWRAEIITGKLEVFKGRWVPWRMGGQTWSGKGLYGFFTTLESMLGIRVIITNGKAETAARIMWLYEWWDKGWDKHKSIHQINRSATVKTAYMRIEKPSLMVNIAAQLPGIGVERARAVEERFWTVDGMWKAPLEEWYKVRGIGRVTARMAYAALHGLDTDIVSNGGKFYEEREEEGVWDDIPL